MNRRTLLAAVGTTPSIALAGCVGVLGGFRDGCRASGSRWSRTPDADTVVGHFAGEDGHFDSYAKRPECDRESKTIEIEHEGETETFETAGALPYPEPPTSFACEDVVDYVEAFDQAYVTNDEICYWQSPPYALGVTDSNYLGTYPWYDDIAIVVLTRAVGTVSWVTENGDVAVPSPVGHESIVYAVDETGAARTTKRISNRESAVTAAEFESRAPDPLDEGGLVAVFE